MASEDSPLAPLELAARALVEWLTAEGVPGALIGGVAVSLLSRPRMTKDIDAMVWVDEERLEELTTTAARHGLRPRASDALAFARESRMLLLRHDPSGIDVDLALGGLPFEKETIDHVQWKPLGNVKVPLPRPEDLIVMKAVAHRPRDAADIEALLESHPGVDRERIRALVRGFAEALEAPEILTDLEALLARGARD